MKRITIAKAKKLLGDIRTDQTTLELIVNNIIQYNSYVDEFNSDEKHNGYLMYQLNVQITKEIRSEKKLSKTNVDEVDDHTFNTVVNAIKNTKSSAPIGFAANKTTNDNK
jgi:hypothetical protein